MFEAYTWIFKKENFKKHYILLLVLNIFSVLPVILLLTGIIKSLIGACIALLLALLSSLPLCGYYWKLVENIIDADTDIFANNIYNGKIKTCLKINLPELNFFKLLWRGIASFVANILLITTYTLIMFSLGFLAGFSGAHFNQFATSFVPVQVCAILIGLLMFYLLVPALFWNYAKNNSVFSILNIQKAIYIAGNYPGRYIGKIFQMLFAYLVNVIILWLIGFPIALLVNIKVCNIIQYIVAIPLSAYFTFVYAYISGTLAPSEEF